ncbi:unnamed protein product [Rotaria socialis]|uniref:Uncharacterized protein n=2 Tax=Rotaria socialis TaxID=392032 RepID=A0A821LZB3_9BILA|nr:unnamed protein product [Rotaria socialis]CAF3338702.1 unnamed protein product [Rotaria socialis]CAF3439170.1 unnamed protein product [Rotaria socialis]CAF4205695.1 unnamed protein product [Rotaria socialis]CAF4478644.1 unnamed protein product [Rotaria socialis]
MASASTRKQCAYDGGCKQVGVAYCEGCTRSFCGIHFNDHRRLLNEELNFIFSGCNEIKDVLNQEKATCDSHPLMKQIDDWEKQSIGNIQQRAKELRQQIILLATDHRNELSQRLQQLSEQSNDALEHDSFSETDLRQWKKIIEDLKANLTSHATVGINQHDYFPGLKNISLVMTMSKELFDRVSDNTIQIEQNGQVATCDSSVNHREIRGRNRYSSGVHKIRLYIEQAEQFWMFLGITSEPTPLRHLFCSAPCTYGWSNDNNIWTNGQKCRNSSNNIIEMKKNDIVSLILDCNNRTMVMINERTNRKYELSVNTANCPFPWQLYLNLNEANSCVRILPT